jgi:hypothetical protein
MRFFTTALVVMPLLLTAAGPAAADEDRGTYVDKAQTQVEQWHRKLRHVGQHVDAKGQQAGDAAERDLHVAWVKTKTASHKLKTVGDQGWSAAKSSFEQASADLSRAWHKVHPEDR